MRDELTRIDLWVGQRLHRLRAERGTLIEHLAADLGVAAGTIEAWEHGEARIGGRELHRICRHFEVDPTYFFEGLDVTETPSDELARLIERSRASKP